MSAVFLVIKNDDDDDDDSPSLSYPDRNTVEPIWLKFGVYVELDIL